MKGLIVSLVGRTKGPTKGQGHLLSCSGQLKTEGSKKKGSKKLRDIKTKESKKLTEVKNNGIKKLRKVKTKASKKLCKGEKVREGHKNRTKNKETCTSIPTISLCCGKDRKIVTKTYINKLAN